MLVLSPEHYRIFRDAGWNRARILSEFEAVLQKPGSELVRGAGGVMEGVVPEQAEGMRHRGFARVYDASDIVHGHGTRQQGDQYAYPPGITEKAEYVGQVGNMRRVWHLCPHLLSVIGMIGSGRHLAVPPRADVLHGSDDTPHSFAHTARGASSNAIGSHWIVGWSML